MAKEELECSFCGRKKPETNLLIAGLDAHICDRCIEQAHGIVVEESKQNDSGDLSSELKLRKPQQIKAFLDEYIIGQDMTKKVMSVAVYNHYKRLLQPVTKDDIEIQKSNIIMVGQTGTGKTLVAKTISRMLNVPLAIVDATVLTEAGYVGEDVESILTRLLQAADYNLEKAEKGIVFIDEIDKIARKSDNPSITRDVSGEGVQQALLKIIEGTVASVPPQGGRKHPNQEMIEIDTKDVLFIVGGAFEGLESKIESRLNIKTVGFGVDHSKEKLDEMTIFSNVLPEDLIKFGLIPELVGRVPIITALSGLDEKALVKILTEPKNSLVKQYKKYLELENVELDFKKDAIQEIAKLAYERKIGARGLRSVMEGIMLDVMYDIPSKKNIKKVTITKESVKNKDEIIIE